VTRFSALDPRLNIFALLLQCGDLLSQVTCYFIYFLQNTLKLLVFLDELIVRRQLIDSLFSRPLQSLFSLSSLLLFFVLIRIFSLLLSRRGLFQQDLKLEAVRISLKL